MKVRWLSFKSIKGGILILDDYGHWKGVYKAVNEYFYEKNIVFNYVDYGCRFAVKVIIFF